MLDFQASHNSALRSSHDSQTLQQMHLVAIKAAAQKDDLHASGEIHVSPVHIQKQRQVVNQTRFKFPLKAKPTMQAASTAAP